MKLQCSDILIRYINANVENQNACLKTFSVLCFFPKSYLVTLIIFVIQGTVYELVWLGMLRLCQEGLFWLGILNEIFSLNSLHSADSVLKLSYFSACVQKFFHVKYLPKLSLIAVNHVPDQITFSLMNILTV